MVVYGCLWLHGCVMDVCIYIYIILCGYLASAPLRPRRGRSGEMADMYSYVWLCNDVYEYLWLCMVCMDVYDVIWLSVDVYACMDVYGCLWMFMGVRIVRRGASARYVCIFMDV